MSNGSEPLTEVRPWGSFTVLLDATDCKVKRITIMHGKRISLQRHQHRAETWTCVAGVVMVELGKTTDQLRHEFICPGESITIPQGFIHRATAKHDSKDAVFIETQTGSYFGEDDIQRFEDDYGRS